MISAGAPGSVCTNIVRREYSHMPTTTVDKPAAAPRAVPQGPTLEEAAHRMEGLLDLREASQGLSKDAAEAPAADDEGVAETEAQETTDETVRAEGDAAETEAETEATEAERPRTVTVTIDGKTETIPLD